jgi:hypothetical protein
VLWVGAIAVKGRNAVVGNGVGDFETEFKMILVCQERQARRRSDFIDSLRITT